MRNRPDLARIDPPQARPITHIRRALAFVAVLGGLLALASLYKHNTCGCSGGVPYTTIGIWATVIAAVSLATYFALSIHSRRR